MFSLLAPRNAAPAQRDRTAPTRLSLEQLDRRQVLSAAPWAVDTTGPVATVSPAMGIPQIVTQTGIAKPDLTIDVSRDGTVKAVATVTAPSAGPLPVAWGTPSRSGNLVTIAINVAPDRGSDGVGAQVITRHRHEYHLGTLPDGAYRLQFTVGGRTMLSREFMVGKDRGATILPVDVSKPQAPTAHPVSGKSSVAPPAPTAKTVPVSPVAQAAAAGKLQITKPVVIPAAAVARGFRVSMSVEDARKTGVAFRGVELNGTKVATTMDFRPGRLNVAVTGGVVTRIVSIG